MAANLFGKCRKILAIGRNYKLHAEELGNKVPDAAFWFIKPTTSFVAQPGKIVFPDGCKDMHHEIELGVFIGKPGKRIPASAAMSHVAGYCVALDMTARDLQNAAKKKGLPWTQAKGFDTSLPHGAFIPASLVPDPHKLTLWCSVNDVEKQRGTTGDMVFGIPELIEACSRMHTLEEGDLILTGTPAGVGPVQNGDIIRGGIAELGEEMVFEVE